MNASETRWSAFFENVMLAILLATLLNDRTDAGLVFDRHSDDKVVSIAATGFAFMGRAIHRGQGEAALIKKALDTIEQHNPPENRGWVTHFLDAEGKPQPWSEVSTIDTAILYEGALWAARHLKDDALVADVERRKAAIDLNFMMKGDYFLHGFYNRCGVIRKYEVSWDSNSEGIILYRAFGKPFTARYVDYGLPLFAYAYPLCFYDDEGLRANLRRAVACQKVRYGRVGVTACDGPDGYQVGMSNVISPLLLEAIRPLVPEVEDTLRMLPVPRHTQGYVPETGWSSNDRVSIDDGAALVLMFQYGGE